MMAKYIFQNMTTIYLLLLVCFCETIMTANVLCVSSPLVSYILPAATVGRALRSRYNHTLTIITDDYAIKSPMFQNSGVHLIESKQFSKIGFAEKASAFTKEVVEGKLALHKMIGLVRKMCDVLYEDQGLLEKLQKRKYDLLLIMPGLGADCYNYLAYKLSLSIIHYGAHYEPVKLGIPFNPSVTPESPFATYGESMTFLQRVQNTFMFYLKPVFTTIMMQSDASRKYVPEKPHISEKELQRYVQLTLLDFDVLLDYPRPSMPDTVFVGGLNTRPPQKLNEDFQSLMDSVTEGIIVVTFGSVFKSFPPDKLQMIFEAMKTVSSLRFVMKYGNESRQDGNIYLRPWLPQNDLLAHKNTRVFITHCGNGGQYESLYHGVPMIGIPVYGDQFYNAERMKNRGYGLYVPLVSLETHTLVDMIKEVVGNLTYKENIAKASQIYKSRLGGLPSERAAYWIDHVIKHGGSYMHSIGKELNWYIYFGIDVYCFILTVGFIFLLICFLCIRAFCKLGNRRRKLKTS